MSAGKEHGLPCSTSGAHHENVPTPACWLANVWVMTVLSPTCKRIRTGWGLGYGPWHTASTAGGLLAGLQRLLPR